MKLSSIHFSNKELEGFLYRVYVTSKKRDNLVFTVKRKLASNKIIQEF